MKHLLTISAVALAWFTDAPRAQGSEVIPYTNRQIIAAADLVATGEITEIFPPPKTGEQGSGYSVARMKLEVVFKGPGKSGETVDIGYWSHGHGNKFFTPDKYTAGEKLTVALHARKTKPDSSNAPPERANAAWDNHYRAAHDEQVQLPPFRKEAEIWSKPASYLKDTELRRTAVYFLAVQGKLPDEELLAQLKSSDPLDQLNGAYSAMVCKSHAALQPLVELFVQLREVKDGKRPYAENTFIDGPTIQAIAAIRYTEPEDAELIVKIVPRIGDQIFLRALVLQVLDGGKQRTAVTHLLAKKMTDELTQNEICVLRFLDARAAWPLFRQLPESKAKTFMAEQGEFKICKDREQLWSSLKQAVTRIEAFQPKSGQLITLDKSAAGKIVNWLSQAKEVTDPKAAASAPTEWIVDLFTYYGDCPYFQAWLTEDGSGGISCLPDELPQAYPELLQMIRAASEKK